MFLNIGLHAQQVRARAAHLRPRTRSLRRVFFSCTRTCRTNLNEHRVFKPLIVLSGTDADMADEDEVQEKAMERARYKDAQVKYREYMEAGAAGAASAAHQKPATQAEQPTKPRKQLAGHAEYQRDLEQKVKELQAAMAHQLDKNVALQAENEKLRDEIAATPATPATPPTAPTAGRVLLSEATSPAQRKARKTYKSDNQDVSHSQSTVEQQQKQIFFLQAQVAAMEKTTEQQSMKEHKRGWETRLEKRLYEQDQTKHILEKTGMSPKISQEKFE